MADVTATLVSLDIGHARLNSVDSRSRLDCVNLSDMHELVGKISFVQIIVVIQTAAQQGKLELDKAQLGHRIQLQADKTFSPNTTLLRRICALQRTFGLP